MAYTYLDATYRSAYLICVVPGCTVPNVTVPAGARIPGVAEHQGQMKLEWTPGAWSTALEFVAISSLNANETGTVAAPGYGLLHAEVGRNWRIAGGELRAICAPREPAGPQLRRLGHRQRGQQPLLRSRPRAQRDSGRAVAVALARPD